MRGGTVSYCQNKFSRRKVIKYMVLGTTIPIMNTLISQVQAAKTSKELVQYRDKPNGKDQCSNCMQFIPGKTLDANGECRVVEGSIDPNGWCNAYAAKS